MLQHTSSYLICQILLLCICFSNVITLKHHTVSVSDSVLFESCGVSAPKKYWKYEGVALFYNRMPVDTRFGTNIVLLKDYSLSITSVSLEHEGTYECSHDKISIKNHSLEVQVPPHVVLSINETVKQETRYVELGKEISVICKAFGAKPAVNLRVMVNNDNVRETEFAVSENMQFNKTFDSVRKFRTRLWGIDGNITCFSEAQDTVQDQQATLQYQTYKKPDLSLKLSGKHTNDVTYLHEKDEIFAECVAKEARPPVNITWLIDNREINIKSETSTTKNRTTQTFNTRSAIRYQPNKINGTITCVTTLGNTGIVQDVERSFYTYAVPEAFITINGKKVVKILHILQGEEIVASCRATGTRPEVDLEWMVNNAKLDQNSGLYNLDLTRYKSNMTTNFLSTLRFLPKEVNGNFTCVVKGHPVGDMYLHARYQINEDNRSAVPATHKSMGSIAIYLVVPTTICLFSLACYFIKKALYVSRQSNLSTNRECSQIGETVQYQRPPKLELPQLPEEVVNPGYTRVLEHETEYCTVLRGKATESRIFYERDLCLILNMKVGQIYNRWMGTVNAPDGTSKCVVISTISDTVWETESINWNCFLKRVLELPDNLNLTKVEGICVDSAHLYLLHEHLICGTLDIRVKEKKGEDASKVMGYLSGILEGMELLHSYGFLHPGLSTKKILLTKDGVCKLYDFCLSENAASFLRGKKTIMNCSVDQLAPEALLRNEYTQAADVWSTAVVIWEIMTGGTPPFSLEGQALNTQRILVGSEAWPGKYQQLRTNKLIDCWNRDSSLRPTINQLRNSFKELFEALGSTNLDENFLQTSLDLYVPMKDSKDPDSS